MKNIKRNGKILGATIVENFVQPACVRVNLFFRHSVGACTVLVLVEAVHAAAYNATSTTTHGWMEVHDVHWRWNIQITSYSVLGP